MTLDMTTGNITNKLIRFALPIMAGTMLQQLYNIADTLIVGRFLGEEALAAVGSSYSFMTFLTSIIIGLCLGSGVFFSKCFGAQNLHRFRQGLFLSFVLIGGLTIILNLLVFFFLEPILSLLQVPADVRAMMACYLRWILVGFSGVFLFNYLAALLRSIGNSAIPLVVLCISSLLNIALDILFVTSLHFGIAGAAIATVLSQYLSAVVVLVFYLKLYPEYRFRRIDMKWDSSICSELTSLSVLTSLQQSVMNFGILMVQGLVNSFGTSVMAAFAAGVKIDSFAYAPAQDFGNAFSTYIAQNYGADKFDRIQSGIRKSFTVVAIFCTAISLLIFLFADSLLSLFIDSSSPSVISIGVTYLRIEGACYIGIGFLFLFYGYFRAMNRAVISLVLTIISLGTRVLLAYTLSSINQIGVIGIWVSIPIGWLLADITGFSLLGRFKHKRNR